MRATRPRQWRPLRSDSTFHFGTLCLRVPPPPLSLRQCRGGRRPPMQCPEKNRSFCSRGQRRNYDAVFEDRTYQVRGPKVPWYAASESTAHPRNHTENHSRGVTLPATSCFLPICQGSCADLSAVQLLHATTRQPGQSVGHSARLSRSQNSR